MTLGLSKDCRAGPDPQFTPANVLFLGHGVDSMCIYYVGGFIGTKTTLQR